MRLVPVAPPSLSAVEISAAPQPLGREECMGPLFKKVSRHQMTLSLHEGGAASLTRVGAARTIILRDGHRLPLERDQRKEVRAGDEIQVLVQPEDGASDVCIASWRLEAALAPLGIPAL